MTDLRTAAQQALDDLKDLHKNHNITCAGTIAALESALAQQAEPVEPVAWRITDGEGDWDYRTELPEDWSIQWSARYGRKYEPLYTAPPQRKPLTDDEILEMAEKAWKPSVYYDAAALLGTDGLVALVRAVERAHKIGDNT